MSNELTPLGSKTNLKSEIDYYAWMRQQGESDARTNVKELHGSKIKGGDSSAYGCRSCRGGEALDLCGRAEAPVSVQAIVHFDLESLRRTEAAPDGGKNRKQFVQEVVGHYVQASTAHYLRRHADGEDRDRDSHPTRPFQAASAEIEREEMQPMRRPRPAGASPRPRKHLSVPKINGDPRSAGHAGRGRCSQSTSNTTLTTSAGEE